MLAVVRGQTLAQKVQDAPAIPGRLAHGQATDRVAVETDLTQTRQGRLTEVVVDAPLNDPKQGRRIVSMGSPTALGPA